MLKYLTIRNFKSILDLKVDLSFGEGKAPNGWRDYEMMPFIEGPGGHQDRYVPMLAIYGANASGKTNILGALQCFQNAIRHGIEGCFMPNRINPKYKTIRFEVGIQRPEDALVYELEYDGDAVRVERLSCCKDDRSSTVFEAVEGKLNARELSTELYGEVQLAQIFAVECTDGNNNQNKTFLNCLVRNYTGLSDMVVAVADVLLNRTAVYLHNDPPLFYAIDKLSGARSNERKEVAFKKIVAVLRKFDFSLREIKMTREEASSSDALNRVASLNRRGSAVVQSKDFPLTIEKITTYHDRVSGGLEPFDFMTEESEGTKVAAGLVGICLWALDRGAAVFFDELDRSLHPIILLELVRMFKRKSTNSHGAQLVFTLHDTTMLEDPSTRVSEVAVVNNNAYTGTTLTRLSELDKDNGKVVRNVHNFRKQYMEGLLSGVPHPLQ